MTVISLTASDKFVTYKADVTDTVRKIGSKVRIMHNS